LALVCALLSNDFHGARFEMAMRVILPIDFSTRSERVVREAAEREWPPHTEVLVLGAVDNIPPSAAELYFDAGGSLDAVMAARQGRVEELVARAAGVLRAKGLTIKTRVRRGRQRKALATEIKGAPADLILK
jgi:nucleotide-binding universal stress UspA family protein